MSSLAKTTNQREEEILTELRRAGGSCRVSFLAERLGVSNETIRRNIRSLEDNEVVRKVHGGVHLVHRLNEAPFQNRMDTQAEIKTRLRDDQRWRFGVSRCGVDHRLCGDGAAQP